MTIHPRFSPKKTEMIEVRVSHETKRDFLTACRREGRTASEVIRGALEDYIADGPRFPKSCAGNKKHLRLLPNLLRRKRYLVLGAIVGGFTLVFALPGAAQPHGPPSAARFDELDRNGDGEVSFEEFSRPGA